MSVAKALWICRVCGFSKSIVAGYFWRCPLCGSALDLSYRPEYGFGGRGLDRFRDLLPFAPDKYRGEGETKTVGESIEGVRVFFKLEYLNPSGSFKDRGTSLAIYYAYKMGFREVVEDSSGNAGISVAMYSSVYGLHSTIVVPRTISATKKRLIEVFGGKIVEVDTRDDAAKYAQQISSRGFYVAHTWNPIYIYGAATIAFEIHEEIGEPDVVIVPTGSGGLLLGILKGFEILKNLGKVKKIPKPIVVQGYSVQPVYKDFKGFESAGEESTLAEGIAVPNPPRLNEITKALEIYGGDVVLVGNSEIVNALKELTSMGFLVEHTSSTAYAAFKKIKRNLRNLNVLIPLTGSGLKLSLSMF